MPNIVAVLDLGKTNLKLLAIDADGRILDGETAENRPVAGPPRPSATRSTDRSLGGSFLHWCSAPSGRTVRGGIIFH